MSSDCERERLFVYGMLCPEYQLSLIGPVSSHDLITALLCLLHCAKSTDTSAGGTHCQRIGC